MRCTLTLFRWPVQYRVDLNDEARHHDHRTKRKSQKPETVSGIFQGHNEKTDD